MTKPHLAFTGNNVLLCRSKLQLKSKFNDNRNINFDSFESLGNVIKRKLGVGELSNRSIEKMYHQYDTDTDDIDGGRD